jgi:hypothetical protein
MDVPVLFGADAEMARAEVERRFRAAGRVDPGGRVIDVPPELWTRVVGSAEGGWDLERVHDGRHGRGWEWAVRVGEEPCAIRGGSPYSPDALQVACPFRGASGWELQRWEEGVAPADLTPLEAEVYRALRADLTVADAYAAARGILSGVGA